MSAAATGLDARGHIGQRIFSTAQNNLSRGNDNENPGPDVQYSCEIPVVKVLIPRDSAT